MSRMVLKSSKPPLPCRSPIRLRSRPALKPTTNTILTPPSVSVTKSEQPDRQWGIRPEYQAISSELRALARMVNQEIGKGDDFGKENRGNSTNPRSPLFERGKLYEEYSARRNERLTKRKAGPGKEAEEEERKTSFGLGVRVESAMKRVQSGRKTVPATPVSRRRETPAPEQTPRYMLRSMTGKEKNKAPFGSGFMSAGEKKKKSGVGIGSSSSRRHF